MSACSGSWSVESGASPHRAGGHGGASRSISFSSNLWFDWFTVLKYNCRYPEPSFAIHVLPLIPRLAIAAVMIVVAARYDARWVVPIAAMIALPYIRTRR